MMFLYGEANCNNKCGSIFFILFMNRPSDDSLTHVKGTPLSMLGPSGQQCDFLGRVGKFPLSPPQPH